MAALGPGTPLIAALPIREQDYSPQQPGTPALELLLLGAMLAGVVVLTLMVIRWRGRRELQLLGFHENLARAQMDGLCARGWTATVTLRGGPAQDPRDAPGRRRVQVEWTELGAGDSEVLVARRVSADSIATALRAMVEDRRLDFELERIEDEHDERHRPPGG